MATRKKSTRKKSAARKKSTRKKSSKKKSVRKKGSKKSTRKKATRKKSAARKKSTGKKVARKKSTRKKTTKKTTSPAPSSKPSSRKRVYNLTRDVPEYQYFVLANGKPVKHVAELASLLDQIEDHVFHHHVQPDKNDFHNWVKDVFEDVELARKIAGVSNKKHLQLVIYKHLAGHDE